MKIHAKKKPSYRKYKKPLTLKDPTKYKVKNYIKPDTSVWKDAKVHHFLKWCAYVCQLSATELSLFDRFLNEIHRLEKSKGKKFCVAWIKEIRLCIERFVAGDPLRVTEYVRVNFVGLPRILHSLIHQIKIGNTPLIRVLLSLLTVNRAVILKPEPDYSTITKISKENGGIPKNIIEDFLNYLESNCGDLKKDFRIIPRFKEYHYSSKSSPLGGHALDFSMIELISLSEELRNAIHEVGGPELRLQMEYLVSNYRILTENLPRYNENYNRLKLELMKINPKIKFPEDMHDGLNQCWSNLSPYLRKLVSFSDPEGKTRTVGLSDYWSQAALEPLAEKLFAILKTIPNDRTFDQVKGLKDLQFGTSLFHSLDIKVFTDTFPSDILRQVLTCWFGLDYANKVMYILCGIPFRIDRTNDFISYGTGNPMGLKCSWALTTLCHHLVMYYACRILKIKFSTAEYVMLGDDIVVWKDSLAVRYESIISSLGVRFSDRKTIRGKYLFSFAKQLFTPNGELSPVSYLLWEQSMTNVTSLIDLIRNIWSKWDNLLITQEDLIRETVKTFFWCTRTSWFLKPTRRARILKVILFLHNDTFKGREAFRNLCYKYVSYSPRSMLSHLPWVFNDFFLEIIKDILLSQCNAEIMKYLGQFRLLNNINPFHAEYYISAKTKKIRSSPVSFPGLFEEYKIFMLPSFYSSLRVDYQAKEIIQSMREPSPDNIENCMMWLSHQTILDMSVRDIYKVTNLKMRDERLYNIIFRNKIMRLWKEVSIVFELHHKEFVNQIPLAVIKNDKSIILYNPDNVW